MNSGTFRLYSNIYTGTEVRDLTTILQPSHLDLVCTSLFVYSFINSNLYHYSISLVSQVPDFQFLLLLPPFSLFTSPIIYRECTCKNVNRLNWCLLHIKFHKK